MKIYTKAAKKFYDSKDWKVSRDSYIQKRINIDGGMCEHCKERPGYIVDHKKELNEINLYDVNVSLNHENFQYLCLECSNRKTFSKDKRGVKFDENGNPIFFENR
ncbi:HNH endonuclease [Parvimonas micra]|uniref:HNH endonuclease n=1 Tax=Parvimonas micra TaxID=33033 RepID=UPI00241F6BDF|nr:HNH endonuclease [Parvimonas micra]